MTEATRLRRTRVWDLPTRLFHWALALSVLGLVATGKIGGALLEIHAKLGYLVLVLLLFRCCGAWWGGAGRGFPICALPGPALGLCQRPSGCASGAQPHGCVFSIADAGPAAGASGYRTDHHDEIAFTGPLYPLAPEAWVGRATHYHHGVGQGLILAMVVLHLLAIAWHLRRHNPQLVQAMISGDQAADATTPATLDSLGTRLLALLLLLCCAAAVAALLALA